MAQSSLAWSSGSFDKSLENILSKGITDNEKASTPGHTLKPGEKTGMTIFEIRREIRFLIPTYLGRWTKEEHRLFLEGLAIHGKAWRKIARTIKTRSVIQVRTHAQKYFLKLFKAKNNLSGFNSQSDTESLVDSSAPKASLSTELPTLGLGSCTSLCELESKHLNPLTSPRCTPFLSGLSESTLSSYYHHNHEHHEHVVEKLERPSGSCSPTSVSEFSNNLSGSFSGFYQSTNPTFFGNSTENSTLPSILKRSSSFVSSCSESDCTPRSCDSFDYQEKDVCQVLTPDIAEFLQGVFDPEEEDIARLSGPKADNFSDYLLSVTDFVPPSTESLSLEPFLKKRRARHTNSGDSSSTSRHHRTYSFYDSQSDETDTASTNDISDDHSSPIY